MSLYDLRLNHEIVFNPTESFDRPLGSFQNLDRTERLGMSVAETINLNSQLSWHNQLNYVDPRLSSGIYAGKIIPAVSRITGNTGISYEVTPHWRLRYDANYIGSRYASENVSNQGSEQAAYWVNNVAIQYFRKPMTMSLEINNLFDQRYSTYTLYNPIQQRNTYYPGYGRNLLLTMKVALD